MSSALKAFYVGAILFLLALPIIVVTGISLNEGQSLRFPPQGLSLRWYGALFQESDWLGPLRHSLIIAFCAASLSVIVALPLALYVWSRGNWLGKALHTLGIAPFMLPPVITALGFLVFWVSVGMYGQMTATIISHAIFLVTLPVVTISLGLRSIDMALVEAARTMGASRGQILRGVILPLIVPYIISGFAFAFVLSLNEYIVAYMVAGFTVETLPIKIFNSLRYGYTPIMGVVSVLFVALAILVFGLIGRYGDLPRLLGSDRSGER
ncbi:MAG: ABC transporter permease [Salinarimonas sp.]|nr:ABC transporter permease [Salinarimonas sp.]